MVLLFFLSSFSLISSIFTFQSKVQPVAYSLSSAYCQCHQLLARVFLLSFFFHHTSVLLLIFVSRDHCERVTPSLCHSGVTVIVFVRLCSFTTLPPTPKHSTSWHPVFQSYCTDMPLSEIYMITTVVSKESSIISCPNKLILKLPQAFSTLSRQWSSADMIQWFVLQIQGCNFTCTVLGLVQSCCFLIHTYTKLETCWKLLTSWKEYF